MTVVKGLFVAISFSLAGMSGVARAGLVRGTVQLPPERHTDSDSHWRVENGLLPIQPRAERRTGVVVIFEPAEEDKGAKSPPASASVSCHGLRLDPQVSVVGAGATVELRNDDRVAHTFYVMHPTAPWAAEPLPSGEVRSKRLTALGEYRLRDTEYAHMSGTVLVVTTPYIARLDERSGFRIDLPEGRYTLRVFAVDHWALSQPLVVGPKTSELELHLPDGTQP